MANPAATSHAGQHGGIEVFWRKPRSGYRPGWYWWSCQPGCLPDGEASGPFDTSEAAYDDAFEDAEFGPMEDYPMDPDKAKEGTV